jgi:hypothetical protein
MVITDALYVGSFPALGSRISKVSGDSLAFGLIAIIQPFVKFPGDSLSTIFKNIDLPVTSYASTNLATYRI